MIKVGNQAGGKAIGGFHDADQLFGAVIVVKDLVPVITGGSRRVVCAVEDVVAGVLHVVHLEHIGFFLPKSHVATYDHAWLALRIALKQARAVVDAYAKNLPVPLACPPSEDLLEPVPDEAVVRETLGAARETLEALVPLFGQTGVKVSKDSRVGLVARVRARLLLMPSNAFEALCEAYVGTYLFAYPHWAEAMLVAAACHCDDLFHVATTRKIFTPLWVEKAEKTTTTQKFGNEDVEVTETRIFFVPFAGFYLQATGNGAIAQVIHDSETVKPSLTLTNDEVKNSILMEEAVRLVAASGASKDPKWRTYDAELRAIEDFYNQGPRYAQQVPEKYLKLACQLPGMIALLQSQLRLNSCSWSIASAPRKLNVTMDPLEQLKWLQEHYHNRIVGSLNHIDKASDRSPMGIFEYVDVCLSFGGEYGSVPPSNAPVVGPASIRLHFIKGGSAVWRLLKGILKQPCVPPGNNVKHSAVPVVGLWSAYNSYEFTEVGNMGLAADAAGKSGKQYLKAIDPDKLPAFGYEAKYVHGAPPNAIIHAMYNLRHTLLTTAGAFLGIGVPQGVDGSNTAISTKNSALVESVKCIFAHGPKGFFGRVRMGPQETFLNTFDSAAGVTTIKAKGLYRNKKGVKGTRSPNFDHLEWITNPDTNAALLPNLPKKIAAVVQAYDMKKELRALESKVEGGAIYYLRPFFVSPMAMLIKTAAVLTNKGSYVNAPMSVNAVYNVTLVNASFWCTISMEGNKWDKHNAYQISLDKNRLHYNDETVAGWHLGQRGASGPCESADDIVAALMSQLADEDDMITSSCINEFLLQKNTYEVVVAKLIGVGKFLKDEEFMFADEVPRLAFAAETPVETSLKRSAPAGTSTGLLKAKRPRNEDDDF